MEEDEIMNMLSENLKIEVLVHLNGKMLHETKMFSHFNEIFLSQLTFILKREAYTIDEDIFEEEMPGDSMIFITKGNMNIVHKKSATFIKEIGIETFVGEISFFTG